MPDKRVALVTGAGRGIGRGIALALAEQHWTIVVNYRENFEAANDVVATIQAAQGEAIALQADIAHTNEHTRLVEQILSTYGQIDLLVNNAGMAPRQRRDLLEMTEASYDEVMAVNLKGPFFLTQHIAQVMIDLKAKGIVESPRIINIGSMSAYISSTNRAEYCVSKAGMGMMTLLFADRLAEYGINVYEVRPGIIATDMTHGVSAKYDKLIADGITPIRRWGHPDDVAKTVVAIAEGYLPFSTGEVINVDGGIHFHRL